MNRLRKLEIVLLLLFFAAYLKAQRLYLNNSVTGVCYAGTKVNRIYVPPPDGFLKNSIPKGDSRINVIYSGFSSEARVAVQYAVNILESVLPSDANLTVKATWMRISDSGVLGNSSITGFATGWSINALDPRAYYPVSLAEKISGESLNGENEADIELVLNSTASWYLGTDGNTPVSKYDLVTVVIHELCHGLGFFDSMMAENLEGSYGLGSIPIIYDKYVENISGNRLTDTTYFSQNSNSLYRELVSGRIFFNGPVTRRYLNGDRAKLYSPPNWDPGSSISHFDEASTPPMDALMTPFIDYGEAIHNPGLLTLSLLGDLGWISTRISHEEIKDTEENLSSVELIATITSDTIFNKDMIGLVYSFNGFNISDTIIMDPVQFNDTYRGIVQIPSYNSKLEYYFFVSDSFSRLYKLPSLAEENPFSFYIGADTIIPIISHTPPEYFFENIDSVQFKAEITDNTGIDTAYLEYRINNGPVKYFGFKSSDTDEYNLMLNLKPELLKGGDTVKYRIIAIDKALIGNSSVNPREDYYSFRIETLLPPLKSYYTDFSDASEDFLNSGFEITKPLNFNSLALHSEHPYRSSDDDNKSLEFSTVLRHPLIFDASGMVLTFRELVLVEPGAEGSVFGFSDFFDYVIIEASKDFGKNWFPLAEGYDSRFIPSWETLYNSLFDGQNSAYEGKESLMLEHSFYPRISELISEGDSLLIRFRLYSDPYANGWGWVIDDLSINPIVDNIEEPDYDGVKVFQNPGDGKVNIRLDHGYIISNYWVSVFDLNGRCILHEISFSDEVISIDISQNPAGLYLIVIENGRERRTMKYNLIK
jgi:hypothetical protein